MTITFESVAIGSGLGAAVPPLSLTLTPGEPTVIAVEGDERPLLVSMLIGGRMQGDSGRVLLDGREDAAGLRRRVALVDTPFVAEPPAGISLASVVAEEFSFAGSSTSGPAVIAFLTHHGLADYAKLPLRALPPLDRVRLFSELALLREGVDVLVITSPERHGADPSGWYQTLATIAERGIGVRDITVAIVTDVATRDILIQLGARDALAETKAAQ
jgi:ABC-2 type transport system ATP-binding protein